LELEEHVDLVGDVPAFAQLPLALFDPVFEFPSCLVGLSLLDEELGDEELLDVLSHDAAAEEREDGGHQGQESTELREELP